MLLSGGGCRFFPLKLISRTLILAQAWTVTMLRVLGLLLAGTCPTLASLSLSPFLAAG